jgi:putative membrane protein
MHTLLHLAVLTGTILVLSRVMARVRVKSVGTAILVAVVFSLLNWGLGWLIKGALFVPAILTLGILFLFIPFIVNLVLLWITDKLLHAFEIQDGKSLLLSAAAITLVNGVFHLLIHGRHW